jgi:glycerol kinase
MHTGTDAPTSEAGLLTTIAATSAGEVPYALEGSIFVTGSAVQWLRDGLGVIHESRDVEGLAASVSDTGDVYFVPALTGLGAPHWDAYARGTIVGITRGTTAAHLARATLEAIAFQTRDVVEAMRGDAGLAIHELKADGGAGADDLLMQLQADVLGVPVLRPRISETTALGAAYLAGLGVGVWSSREEVARHWRLDREFAPSADPGIEDRYARWRRAVERSLSWASD